MSKHPSSTLLSRFGRGLLSRRKSREVVRHLLTDCDDCRQLTAGLGSRADYHPAFQSALAEVERMEAVLRAERKEADEQLRELLAQPFDRQQAMVTSGTRRYLTWPFCELLLETAREWGFQDPGRALELTQLGVEIASRLDPAAYGGSRVHDLEARAWAALGNAQRIRSDFREAEKSFQRAERLLKLGTGDPVEKAQVLLLKASLRGNQQRFPEALRLVDRVMALGRRCADPQLQGRALIMRGLLFGLANDPEPAIRHLTEGLQKVDGETDPRLVVAARHNLTLYLAESGRYVEALRLLESARPLYHQIGDQMSLLRLRWLEGKIASALGHFTEAEELLRGVHRELIERELGFDAALLSLDLATIYARQARGAEMRRLAEEMLPIFKSRDIHREAIAALFVFQKAAEMERVTLGLIRDVSGYLKDSRASWVTRSRDSR